MRFTTVAIAAVTIVDADTVGRVMHVMFVRVMKATSVSEVAVNIFVRL